jgi:xylulokinase
MTRSDAAPECVLAIDLGTGGPKVALVDAAGTTLAWRSAPVATTHLDGGGAEQDPEQMWRGIVTATRAVLGMAHPHPQVVGVAVTSQYFSTVPVAADGTPTGPCILWMDTRGGAHNLSLLTDDNFMLFVERHGLIPLPSGNDNVAHVHVLREHHPDAYAAAAAFVEPMDYVNARLTGRLCATQSTAFGQLVCDNRTWGATEYDPELVAATQLDPDKLAPLVPMNGVIGEVTSQAAAELGIAAGLPVVPGTIDSITSAIGSGAIDAHHGSIVIGTTSVLVSHITEHRGDLGGGILSVPSPLPGRYYVMAENGLGGRALEWAMRMFGYGDRFDEALGDAAVVAAGAGGAQFLPWLLGSIAPQPDEQVRAAFVGLGLEHDRRHALRATLEGVALNLAWLLPAVEAFVGNPFPFVRFGGGGAQSALWGQVLADALDRPVHRLADPRVTNARGAAFLALAELDRLDLSAIPVLLQVQEPHEPDAAHRVVMDAALARHAALHPALAAQA